jgi:large repetitive protein
MREDGKAATDLGSSRNLVSATKRSTVGILVTLAALLAVIDAAQAAGPAHRLMDINPTPSWEMGSFPGSYHRLGEITLFQAWVSSTGDEMWRTDGTQAGTFLVKDIRPGREGGIHLPFDPVVLGDKAFFPANDGVHGWELWRTDGTEAGTVMVKEIRPGPEGSLDTETSRGDDVVAWNHVELNGILYFLANDRVHGFEVWRTDGTEAGTFLLKDILPGIEGSFGFISDTYISLFSGAGAGGSFFFAANDGVHGFELWKTDGTSAGTTLFKDINPGPNGSYPGYPDRIFGFGGGILFPAMSSPGDLELWRSDGTDTGTYLLKDISPGGYPSFPQDLVELSGAVVFMALKFGQPALFRTDGTSEGTKELREFPRFFDITELIVGGNLLVEAFDDAHGYELWKTDGTQAGTQLIKDILPGSDSSRRSVVLELGGQLFFMADDGVHGLELWTSDWTEAGTHLAVELNPGPDGTEGGVYKAGRRLYLYQTEGSDTGHLWKTDGTAEGTRRLKKLGLYSIGSAPDGMLLAGADDGVHGTELWKSDGTEAGTVLVKDINSLVRTISSSTYFQGSVSVPGIGRRMLFAADDGVHGFELWTSDGTTQGTRLLKEIQPGANSSYPGGGVARGDLLLFGADDGEHGYELWRSDGTAEGTVMVADISPGAQGSVASEFVELKGSIYFAADDQVHGVELWKSDGTLAGTVLAVDINPGPDSSYPWQLFAVGETLYFILESPVFGIELWKTDGTEAGTGIVKDILSGQRSSSPLNFSEIGGKLFMSASDGLHGREPFISDGTEAGTNLLLDVRPGGSSLTNFDFVPRKAGDSLYFVANDGTHGEELWKTDGTSSGTLLVKDVVTGAASTNINSGADVDGTFFFSVGRASWLNDELWKTDGTEDGTVMVKNGLGNIPYSYGLNAVKGGLLFMAWDENHGYELWRSDGTGRGTDLAQDIWPGEDDSRPASFTQMGSRVFFLADDGAAGVEPWVARTAILLRQPGRAIGDLADEVKALHLPKGLETSLTAMLDAAARALSGGRTTQAVLVLEAFSRHLDALTPVKISQATGDDLREFAGEIVALLDSTPTAAAPAEAPNPAVAGPPRILTGR